MIPLFLLAASSAWLSDQSTAYLNEMAESRGAAPFVDIIWAERPRQKLFARLAPQGKAGFGYGHVLCAGLSRSGKPVRCRTAPEDGASGLHFDPDFERVALRLVKSFRAAPESLVRRGDIKFVEISLKFTIPDDARRPDWGDCQPFCVIEGPPPPPPPPPTPD